MLYEPVMKVMTVSKKRKRQRALSRLATRDEAPPPGLITCLPTNTPDLVLHLTRGDGSQALAIGDMVYAPVQPDSLQPGDHACQAVESKLHKVQRMYASKAFLVSSQGGIVLADEACSFVIYPGREASEAYLAERGSELTTVSMTPGKETGATGAHQAAIDHLLEGLMGAAGQPRALTEFV